MTGMRRRRPGSAIALEFPEAKHDHPLPLRDDADARWQGAEPAIETHPADESKGNVVRRLHGERAHRNAEHQRHEKQKRRDRSRWFHDATIVSIARRAAAKIESQSMRTRARFMLQAGSREATLNRRENTGFF